MGMLRRILFALVVPGMFAGCVAYHRPRVVQPQYVARCPAGYVYDGNDCHERYYSHRY